MARQKLAWIRAGGGGGGHLVLARRTHAGGGCWAWWSQIGLPRAEGPSHVTISWGSWATRHVIVVGLAICGASLLGAGGAYAQGKLEARYSVTLGGVSFGQGSEERRVGKECRDRWAG